MQLDDAGERVELRVFVDKHRVAASGRRRHERIRERNFVRRLQLRRFNAQGIIRMVPRDGKLSDGVADPRGLLCAAIMRQDISHFRERDEGSMQRQLAATGCLEKILHALKTRLLVGERDERGRVQQE